MTQPRASIVLAVLTATLVTILPGCGDPKPKDSAKDTGKGAPTANMPQTPEDLAKQVVAALKANDYNAFRALCVDKEDIHAIAKSMPEKVREEWTSYAEKEFTPERETQLKIYFDFAVKQVDWKTVEVTKIVAAEVQKEPDVPPKVGHINVELSTGWKLTVQDSANAPRGWVIGDDNPIHVANASGKTLFPALPEPKPRPPVKDPSAKPIDGKGSDPGPTKDISKEDIIRKNEAHAKDAPPKNAPAKDAPIKDKVK